MCAFRSRSGGRRAWSPLLDRDRDDGGRRRAAQRRLGGRAAALRRRARGCAGEAELQALIAFFRARRGAAVAFRFEDPFDNSSNGMTGTPGAADQPLGTGDGVRTGFALVKRLWRAGAADHPAGGGERAGFGGRGGAAERLDAGAAGDVVRFEAPPAAGAEVRAGFRFDVPVRFAEDRLSVSRATFVAGEIPSVPLIEVREG